MLRRIGRVLFAIYSPFFILQLGINTSLCALVSLVSIMITGHGRFSYLVGRFWSRLNLLLTGVRVTIRGTEHIQPGQPYLVMANHQSLYDVWAVIGRLPMQLRFIIKHTIRTFPLVGFTLERQGHIFVDRGRSDSAAKSIDRAAKKISGGISVFFFPEGTRSPDGRLIDFKSGGFRLAQASGVPILPLTVNGGRKIARRGSLQLLPGRMDITVHAPIPIPEGEERAVRRQLMEQVRQAIETALRVE